MRKSQEIETALISQQSSYSSEVEGLKRLTDLYKRHFEEATTKVEELEQSLSSLRDVHNTKINKYKDELKSLVEEKDAAFLEERKALKARIIELENKLSTLPILSIQELQQAAAEPPKISNPQDFADFSLTDMYDKVVHLEQDLHQERLRRKEMETYMNQMLKDIEQKAPIIAKQRRDYQRIVQSHTELTAKLDGVVTENNQLKQVLKDLERRTSLAEHETNLLNTHNHDLARQIQHLLTVQAQQQSGYPRPVALIEDINTNESEAQSVISGHLVVYNNVEELQQRNSELLQVIRKLTDEKEASAASSSRMEVDQDEEQNQLLHSALAELDDLKQQRTKTEEMLAVLLQQRDMYRAMLEGDLAANANVEGATSGAASSVGTFATPLKMLTDRRQSFGTPKGSLFGTPGVGNEAATNLAKELQLKLDYAEDEKRRIQDRLQRYEEAEKVLHESLDKLRQELTTAKMDSAQYNSEAKFLKERVSRLESALTLSQQEAKNTLQRRMELEKSLLEYQKEVRLREDTLTAVREELRQNQDQLRRQIIELEVTKQSETRLIQQVNEAREEVKRHATLTDYLHRIEAGLQSRSEEEKESLLREKDTVKKAYETLRKQVDDKNAIDEQKSKALDDELRSLRTKLEVKVSEVSTLNEALIKEQSVAKSSQERSVLLEKQLSIVQDKLNMLQGNSIVESLLEKEMAEKEMALQQAKNEIESLKNQLQSAEVHVDQFRKLSSANEQALKDIRSKFQEFQDKTENEVKAYEEEIQRLRQESQEHRQSSQQMIQDLEANQDALMKLKQTHQDQMNALQEEKQLLSIEYESVKAQLSTIHIDMNKFQQQAKLAYENYERELQLHAQAERELREERQAIENVKKQLNQAQEQASALSADSMRLARQVQDEKLYSQEEKKRLQDEIESLTRTNDLLHAQVQSFGLQLEKLHESRLQLHAATGAGATAASASVEGTSVTAAGDAAASGESTSSATASGVAGEFDELSELRKSAGEMREVLRFMKREKEMLQARLNIAESENNRYVNQLQSLSKSLDEARTELKKELEARQLSVSNPQEYQKLLQEVSQLNLLRESNHHLRNENEEISKKLSLVTEALDQERNKVTPLEESVRKLQGEKEGLEMVNDQLSNDVGYWKNRLHTLVSRYNDVDPEEHRLLKTNLDESLAKITAMEGQLTSLQTEAAQQLSEVKDQLKIAQDALEQKGRQLTTSEQSNDNLRQKLRQFKTLVESKNEEIAKLNSAKESGEKEAAEAQLKNASLTSQVQELTSKLDGANSEITSLNTSVTKLTAALQKANERVPALAVAAPATVNATAVATETAPVAAIPASTPAVTPAPAATPVAGPTPGRPVRNAAAKANTAAQQATTPAPPATAPPASSEPVVESASAASAAPVEVAVAPTTAAQPTAAPVPTPAAAGGDKAAQLKQALMNKKRGNVANAKAAAAAASTAAAPVGTPVVAIAPAAVEEAMSSKSSTADISAEAEGAPAPKKARPETTPATASVPTPAIEQTVEPASMPMTVTTESVVAPQPSFIAPVGSQTSTSGGDVPGVTVTGTPSLEEGEEVESAPRPTKPAESISTPALVTTTSAPASGAPVAAPAANTSMFKQVNPFARTAPIAAVPATGPTPTPTASLFGGATSIFGAAAAAQKPGTPGPFGAPTGLFGSAVDKSTTPVAAKPNIFGSVFGAPTTAAPASNSLFGGAAAATAQPTGFGSTGGGIFGSSIFGAAAATVDQSSVQSSGADTKVRDISVC
jgi:nucleoprotein TPR